MIEIYGNKLYNKCIRHKFGVFCRIIYFLVLEKIITITKINIRFKLTVLRFLGYIKKGEGNV